MKRLDFYIILIVSLILLGCNTTKPGYKGLANLMINVSITDEIIMFGENFTLQNNKDSAFVYQAKLLGANLVFNNIEAGTYSLIFNNKVLDDRIRIDSHDVVHSITLDYRDPGVTMVTIQNHTSSVIDTILITERLFNVGQFIPKPLEINTNLEIGENFEIMFLGFPAIRIRLKGNDTIYTKYDINLSENQTVMFSENDAHSDIIKDPDELGDFALFDIQARVITNLYNNTILIHSRIRFRNLSIHIDGIKQDLMGPTSIPYTPYHYSWQTDYDFKFGQTYQIRFINDHADNPIDEILYFRIVNEMIIESPVKIDEKNIELKWTLNPNNEQNNDFTRLRIRKGVLDELNNFNTYFEHKEVLQANLRVFNIPAGFIPSPHKNVTGIGFDCINYAISNRISIQQIFVYYGVSYNDGVLEEYPQNIKYFNINDNSIWSLK